MSTPQWNADIITPSISVDADVDIQTNGGLDKDASGALGVKVDNSTITINSAGALQANGGGTPLPEYTSSDAGEALVVNSAGTGVEWASVGGGSSYTFTAPLYEDDGEVTLKVGTAGLVVAPDPDTGSDVLTVAIDGNTIVSSDGTLEVANPLPAATASDAGKVLSVNSSGNAEWASVGGGSSYTFTDGISEVNGTVSLSAHGAASVLMDGGTAGLTTNSEGSLAVAVDDTTIELEWDAYEQTHLHVKNPLPACDASDAGKVLSVDSSGSAGWEASKSLAAGSGISITESSGVVTIAASGGGSSYTFTDGVSESSGVVSVDHPVPAPAASDSGKMLSCVDTSGTLGWVAPAAGLTMGHNNMTLSGGGMLEVSYGFSGKGWYIGNLFVGSGANTPVTGPVTGTTLMLTGYTNSSFANFAGTGSVVNLNYTPIAVIQFLFFLNSADNGISLSILDSTGADVTSTLATGVTNRLEWFKMTSTL